MDQMLKHKIGQMIIAGFPSPYVDDQARRLVEDFEVGNFGPVLDVNLDPMNPIIGSRSYSDDPETVARMGVEMIRGMHDGGMLATLKHYPGHGNVATDSHLGVPHNPTGVEELTRTEWMPFQRAINAGADAIMTAHVVYDQVDPEYPATVSKKIMTGLLRQTMHFEALPSPTAWKWMPSVPPTALVPVPLWLSR